MSRAASVRIQEIDLSTRVASFAGVYGAIQVQAKKGISSIAQLMVTDKQLLDTYTPNGRVEVGYDLAHYSALSFLERSDKLWTKRVTNQAYFAGLLIKGDSSSLANRALPSDSEIEDINSFVFDQGEDAPAISQVQALTFIADSSSSLDQTGAVLYDEDGSVAFWIDVDDSGSTIPAWASAADRAVEVTTIAQDDSANDVAAKMAVAINADSKFSASANAAIVTVANTFAGALGLAEDNGATSDISTVTLGADAIIANDEALFFFANSEGAFGNDIGIRVTRFIDDEDFVGEENAFVVEVFKRGFEGSPVESFLCSRQIGAKDGFGRNIYIEDVMQQSNYIRVKNNPAIEDVYPKAQEIILYMDGGDDGLAVTSANMVNSLQIFANPDDLPVTIVMDGGYSVPAYQIAIDSLCKSRMDCVGIFSTPYSTEVSATYLNDIVNYRKNDLNLNSSYSALYTPHLKIQDRFNDRQIFVSPDGHVAGSISFNSENSEIWFPPAGFRRGVLNVLDVSRRFEKGEMDALYMAGINPIRFFPGRGIVIWGQKTLLSRPSSLNRLNVRLLLIVIEPALKEFLEDYLFELNNEDTRSDIDNKITNYLTGVKSRKGMLDFDVVCDESNNTPTVISNNQLICDVFIKPSYSIEDIPLRVVLVSPDTSFSDAAQAI
jgi:hypothetical protein